jgi:hypothetical protein
MEYEVPRRLDVPDRLGIPFFTTVQFFILVAALVVTAFLWARLPETARPWLIYLPLAAFVLPREVPPHGWTVYRLILSKVGRLRRPRRLVWRPVAK